MEPIKGTNVSLAIAEIAVKYLDDANKLDTARASLVLDAVRQTGAQIVELLEGLGENIDTYV